jgi:hypothetical protein
MNDEVVAEIATIILFGNDKPDVFSSGKRFPTPDDEHGYWELEKMEFIQMPAPDFIHFGCFGWTPEGKTWGFEVVHSGDYSIYFDSGRLSDHDIGEASRNDAQQ